MKRFSKILALTILLSVVVSAFGIFSSFAETNANANAPTNEAVTHFDLDKHFETNKNASGYVSLGTVADGNMSYPGIFEKTDNGENTYYSFGYEGMSPDIAYPSGDIWKEIDVSDIVFFDHTYASTTEYKKNAEAMIIDLDYNTRGTPLSSFCLNLFFMNASKRHAFENFYIENQVAGDNLFSLGLRSKDDISGTFYSDDGWMDITMIVIPKDGAGVDTYYYVNGFFLGVGSASGSAVRFDRFRLEVTAESVNGTNASVLIDNFTIKSLPLGYDGILLDEGVVGNKYIALDSIPELGYCLDNHPNPIVTAEVKRGEETLKFNTINDLDGALQNGDIVTLNRYIDSTILIPKGANITWQGNYPAPNTLEVDFEANDWVVRNLDGTLFAEGSMGIQDDGTGTYADNLTTYLSGVTSSAAATYTNILVTFLKDTTIGASTVNGNLVYDFNGNTITATGANTLAAGDKFTVMNGSLIFKTSSANFVSSRYDSSTIEFSIFNMDSITYSARAKFDYLLMTRGGNCIVILDDCRDIETNGATLIYAGSRRSLPKSVVLRDCNFTLKTIASIVKFTNSATASLHYGDTEAYLAASGVTATSDTLKDATYKKEIFSFEAYADEDTSSQVYTEKNIASVNIKNSNFTVGSDGLIGFNLATAVDGLNFDCDVNLDTVTVTTPGVVTTKSASTITATDYAYTVDANVKNCSFNYTNNSGFINRTATSSTVNCNFGEGTKFSSYALVGDGESTDGITEVLPEGCKVAHTALYESYNEIVTSNYTNNNYAMADGETSGQFFWNGEAGDNINLSRFATLTAAGATYKYEWEKVETAVGYDFTETLAPNFKPSVSLSTNGYLAINVFVPEGVAIKNGAYVIENGVSLGQYGETATYNMAKIEAIDPTDANVDYTVDVTITGAYGDTLDKSVNVSVIKYAASVLANYTDENSAENKYAVALLGYIKSVMEYAEADYTEAIEAIDTALNGKTAAAATKPNAVENKGSANGVTSYAMNLGGSINWVITANAGATYTVKVGNGNAVARTVGEDGNLYISVRAYEVFETVTVSDGENTLTFNISNYYNEPTTTSDAKVVVDALAAYAETAVAYKAQLNPAN